MYNNVTAPAAAGGATSAGLAATGANTLWVVLAGFAMVAAGTALMRIAPRFRRSR